MLQNPFARVCEPGAPLGRGGAAFNRDGSWRDAEHPATAPAGSEPAASSRFL